MSSLANMDPHGVGRTDEKHPPPFCLPPRWLNSGKTNVAACSYFAFAVLGAAMPESFANSSGCMGCASILRCAKNAY